ncbi:DUF296 domain-containing protein [Pyrococcus furiosus DSM 3638]|uniref:PPC domain-containing protein n=3 Tax=Pyrococcus furiosus TaxID=2261 RepID=Q8U353_PYRFU|nr:MULTISPECIES: PPC domain-containing DNA-binding protein [Pyrococcus]AAL80743.1 hypothetical protein PF0619 [Pyrococcus furiosus DSM 3638]AFN03412.1 hypothetical protein PFC_02235 [Pyrococcus furiosus COM1]MDK2869626.1 uncharacterized protein [Pyrococcus sp.]QEK78324.1 DUF296 domain-containing protein [Pyrococcus furiosus DSM 3638]
MLVPGRVYLFRIPEGKEIIEFLREFAEKENIKVGIISAIGTLRNPVIGYFMEEEKKYKEISLTGTYELLSLSGNISLKDGKPFVHAHVVLGDSEGRAFGGHLVRGEVFVAEVFVQELEGETLERKPTEHGLALW